MTKGIFYLVWGKSINGDLLNRSVESSKRLGLPIHIEEMNGHDAKDFYAYKRNIFIKSPFDLTLYLDDDTVILDNNLDLGFSKALDHTLAMHTDPVEGANRHDRQHFRADESEFNTGVMFFHKNRNLGRVIDKLFEADNVLNCRRADQAYYNWAFRESYVLPYYLPLNYNYFADLPKNPVTGEIKIWHSKQAITPLIHNWNQYCNTKIVKPTAYIQPNNIQVIFEGN